MTLITHEMSVYASRDTNRRREEMTDRYSMREAREVLKTNEKSLKAWMRKEGIEPQIDLMDERKKYITRAQVEQLARRHGRTLPEEHEEGAPSALPSVEALAAHITMTQQVLERRIDQVDQTLHQVLALLQTREAALARATAPVQMTKSPQSASPPQMRPATTSTQTALAVRKKKKKTTRAKGQKLPQTYVPLRTFALAHQVSPKAMEFASKSGKIPVERGLWRYNNHLYVEALSPTGQQEFYKRFHERPNFQPCRACPHTQE